MDITLNLNKTKFKDDLSGNEGNEMEISKKRNHLQLKRFIKRKLGLIDVDEKWMDAFNFIDCLRKINKFHRVVINSLSRYD